MDCLCGARLDFKDNTRRICYRNISRVRDLIWFPAQASCRFCSVAKFYHVALGPYVPFDGVQSGGSITPLVNRANFGPFTCLFLYVVTPLTIPGTSFPPHWFTFTFSGVSVNLSQLSPGRCVCASGSKQPSFSDTGQHTNALYGNQRTDRGEEVPVCALYTPTRIVHR